MGATRNRLVFAVQAIIGILRIDMGTYLWAWIATLVIYALGLGLSLFITPESPNLLKFGILASGLLLYGWVSYRQLVQPLLELQSTSIPLVIDALLGKLRDKYLEHLGEECDLRMNVMLTRGANVIKGKPKRLRIDYSHGEYNQTEMEQVWKEGIGSCGNALKDRATFYFDSQSAPEARESLDATQRLVTQNLNSILSVPVFRRRDSTKKRPVAVLNIDSRDNLVQTKFDGEISQDLVMKYAGVIGDVLK